VLFLILLGWKYQEVRDIWTFNTYAENIFKWEEEIQKDLKNKRLENVD
jgi:hypothetical protein